MKTKFLRAAAVILCAAMVFSLAACSSGKIESESDKLRVVCTLFVPYDFVREIAGDRVDLTLLLPPGMESHSYDPTPADMKAVSNADLLIRVGENMETWSAKLFDKSTGAGEYLDIASEMGLRLAAHEHEHEHGHEDEHEHEHEYEEGFVDAHIWTDPIYAQGMVKVITDALCRLDSRNAEFYKSNSEKYISKLQSLDAGFKDAVKNGKRDIYRILRPLRFPQFHRAVFAEIRQRARRLRGQLRAGSENRGEDNKHCKKREHPGHFL